MQFLARGQGDATFLQRSQASRPFLKSERVGNTEGKLVSAGSRAGSREAVSREVKPRRGPRSVQFILPSLLLFPSHSRLPQTASNERQRQRW